MTNNNYYSWEVIDERIFLKKTDVSFFKYQGSSIPKQMTKYFFNENISLNKRTNITIIFKSIEYKGYLIFDKFERLRIFWYRDLQKSLSENYPKMNMLSKKDFPIIQFYKINDYKFQLDLIDNDIGEVNEDLVSIIDDNAIPNKEGAKKSYYTTKYERDKTNREQAIKYHGYNCHCCGISFEDMYGEHGKGFIEIHHKKPLYLNNKEVTVNPLTDLVPVCSNCHKMIHRKKDEILTIEELKEIIESNLNSIIEIDNKMKSI